MRQRGSRRRFTGVAGTAVLAGCLVLAGCSSSSPKGGGTVPPLKTAASGASASAGATASARASASPGASSAAGTGPVTPESMSDPDLGYTVVSIPENLDPTQTEVLRAYFAYDKATWRLWFRNEGLDTMDTVATDPLLTEIKHNVTKRNGRLARPPLRMSVSEVSASDDGNGYAVAACFDKTQMTSVDAQGKDITDPKNQILRPAITFMTQDTNGIWRASDEKTGTPNTCSVN